MKWEVIMSFWAKNEEDFQKLKCHTQNNFFRVNIDKTKLVLKKEGKFCNSDE